MVKKASAMDVFGIFILFFVLAVGLFIIHFFTNRIMDNMIQNPTLNQSKESVDSMTAIKTLTARYDLIGIAFFIGLFLSYIVLGYFIGGHPIFMFGYFLITVLAVLISAILSNVWETLTTQAVFGATINALPMTNHIISYFPFYMAIVGMVGLIVMFAKPQQY